MSATVFVALVALVALVSVSTDQAEAAPGDDPLPSPLFTMEFQNLPTDTRRGRGPHLHPQQDH